MSSFLVSCLQTISTSGKNGHSEKASGSPRLIQESLKPIPKRGILKACPTTVKKKPLSSKPKMTRLQQTNNKVIKKNESQNPSGRKQNKKQDNPMGANLESSKSWVCKNVACRATLSTDDSFCKRCSCCVCHMFDDNKDPSLWLMCASEKSGEGDFCGLSCHIECALQKKKVGVVDLGQLMQLDGSYCCAACGKVFGILGCWKKQLLIAKDARRLDVLCYRIYLSYRLLDGTLQFKELHEIVKDAKAKLENEVGPLDGTSAEMARGLVSRLSIATGVQKLCSRAIEKADEWLSTSSTMNGDCKDSLPAACKFQFEEVTPSSVIIHLIELASAASDDIKGYKLWYYKSREETPKKEPVCIFQRHQRRILISNLQPCTEYTFRVISFTEASDLGHSESKCFTKSIEIIQLNNDDNYSADLSKEKDNPMSVRSSGSKKEQKSNSSGFKVRELGKFLHLGRAQENGRVEGHYRADTEKLPSGSRGFDLNVVSVPDLNEEFTPPLDFSRGEDNGIPLEQAVEPDDDAASNGDTEKNILVRCNGSCDSQGTGGDAQAIDFLKGLSRKRKANLNEEPHECDSALVNGSPNALDENFEQCIKIIRWLECEGHINQEFRLKFLTWFSLKSAVQERRVVNTFIQTLMDDPGSLAGQLVDTFSDIVTSMKPKNGFCDKLWH